MKVIERNLNELKLVAGETYELDGGVYTINKVLEITVPCTILGNGSVIDANGIDEGLRVSASHVHIEHLKIKKAVNAIFVDPKGGLVEDVVFDSVDVDLINSGYEVGSTASNGITRDVHIKNANVNVFGGDVWQENELAVIIPYNFTAAAGVNGVSEVSNCVLENLTLESSRVNGPLRIGVNLMSGLPSKFNLAAAQVGYKNNRVSHIKFIGNHFDECWDGTFNTVSNFCNTENSIIEDVEFTNNWCGFGITALYMYACEPVFGSSKGGIYRNVLVKNNYFKRVVKDVGEPTRGIFFGAGRSDYYEGQDISEGLLENIEIVGNIFDGAGPVITAAYCLLDGTQNIHDNHVRNVHVHHNRICNADYAFTFDAVQVEGRRYDWNFGYPRHEKKWYDPITDDSIVTDKMENNTIEDLVCEENEIEGYRYRVVAGGANLRGHSSAKGNKVVKGVVFKNNRFGVGENHVRVADFIGEDFAHDEGGNEVSKEFLKK